jgi:hypothetical protein
VCWGRINATQDHIRTFEQDWTVGTAEVEFSGDAERIAFDAGEYKESIPFNVGAIIVGIYPNYYAVGDTFTIEYKTGVSSVTCESKPSWETYTIPFLSEGFVKVKVTK